LNINYSLVYDNVQPYLPKYTQIRIVPTPVININTLGTAADILEMFEEKLLPITLNCSTLLYQLLVLCCNIQQYKVHGYLFKIIGN